MDRLSPLFNRFSPAARVFHVGTMCQVATFDEADGVGHLHLLRAGKLRITGDDIDDQTVSEEAVVFSPRPQSHRLTPVHTSGIDLVCASVDLGHELQNPFVSALPPLMVIPLSDAPQLFTRIEWLFHEAEHPSCGSETALELLMEYVLILLLRYVMDISHTSRCILSGLGDERLAKAITAIHKHPEKAWTLESLAAEASMSRSRFAHHFREAIGTTPLDYLTDWRLGVARSLLRNGESVDSVAPQVGYLDSTAFSRTFKRRSGQTPRDWLAQNRSTSASLRTPPER